MDDSPKAVAVLTLGALATLIILRKTFGNIKVSV